MTHEIGGLGGVHADPRSIIMVLGCLDRVAFGSGPKDRVNRRILQSGAKALDQRSIPDTMVCRTLFSVVS